MKKAITLIVLGILFLSGCNNETVAPVAVNADTILDQQIYSGAVGAKDAKACERIKDEAMKGECRDVVNALLFTDQAVAKLDKGLCGKIKLSRYEEECGNRVEGLVEQAKEKENKIELSQKQEEDRLKFATEAMEKKDYKLCDKIEDKNQQASCKFNVIIETAKSSKNKTLCDNIGAEGLINECKSLIQTENLSN